MAQPALGAFFHTPGPKELFVRFRQNTAFDIQGTNWQFLGTCVTAPDLATEPKFINVFNDYGGRSVPTQLIWDGSESRVACTVNRIDLAVARNIRSQALRSGTLATTGREGPSERGSLVLGVNDFELIFKNTYFGGGNATPGMVPGRYYFSVVLENYEEHTTGTRVEEVSFLFRCNNLFRGASVGFEQFTEDPSEFPLLISN